eukprot:CAMPEP_0198544054 /NCGR_PEP_ID=MMETSP1462-20131121/60000_1 /TAXON_ID=1333877 /ORGANISM="Brandtodinium nutriculum, Strain RCC3387" /LENGTH=191 /DNA_ID=CAMNT_0044274365 /DNA_START=595 /DNA_END=1167 /DNA_ORIENTATION=+
MDDLAHMQNLQAFQYLHHDERQHVLRNFRRLRPHVRQTPVVHVLDGNMHATCVFVDVGRVQLDQEWAFRDAQQVLQLVDKLRALLLVLQPYDLDGQWGACGHVLAQSDDPTSAPAKQVGVVHLDVLLVNAEDSRLVPQPELVDLDVRRAVLQRPICDHGPRLADAGTALRVGLQAQRRQVTELPHGPDKAR